ncbi:MAG: dienelactone hydrolase family protein, partial [Planctomycetia bacterium]
TAKEDLTALRAPVFAVFGSLDRSIPVSTVGQFVQGLTDAGREHQVSLFRAEHAFANPSSPRCETGSAELAWERRAGVGAPSWRGRDCGPSCSNP